VLAAYLVWTIGALGLGSSSFQHLLGNKDSEQITGYQFVLGKTVLRNADTALSIAFNLPRQWYSQSQLPKGMLRQLRVFRVLVVALLIVALIKGPIEPIAIGTIWFFVTAAPALPLYNHFLPYYLFLPLVGFSLVVGTSFDFGYQLLRRVVPWVSLPLVAGIFAQLLLINTRSVWNEQENNELLGRSARIARETVDTVRALGRVSGEQVIYFLNARAEDLPWQHGLGALFPLSFSRSNMHVMYLSDGIPRAVSGLDRERLRVLDYRHEVLTDVTDVALKAPDPGAFFDVRNLDPSFVAPNDIVAGAGSYSLRLPMFSNRSIEILYSLNGNPGQTFETALNASGEVRFGTGPTTPRGIYRFLGARSGLSSWLYLDDRLVVR